jgi:hypothetical protein
MKPDLYTKAVLTVIAVMLTVIACKTVISPGTTASAQSAPFAGVQYSNAPTTSFFDARTGEIWLYDHDYRGDQAEVPDMPDRIAAATALHFGVPVISRDGRIRASSLQTVW